MFHSGSDYFKYEGPPLEAINGAQRAHTELAKRAAREQVPGKWPPALAAMSKNAN